jgi:hypothetical protein
MVTKILQVVTKEWLENLLSKPLPEPMKAKYDADSLRQKYESLRNYLVEGIDGLPVVRSNLLDAHRARLLIQVNLKGENLELDVPIEHYSALKMGRVNLETMTLQK